MCNQHQKLFDKNKAWAKRVTQVNPDFFRLCAKQHTPKYLWLGCADSRIPQNEMFDLLPGEMFVHRNIANQANAQDLSFRSALEFAVEQLKVSHILVVGHYGCGGVSAAIKGNDNDFVSAWVKDMKLHVCDQHQDKQMTLSDSAYHDYICEQNVLHQVHKINAIPVVQAAKQSRGLTVVPWIYNLSDGLLYDISMLK